MQNPFTNQQDRPSSRVTPLNQPLLLKLFIHIVCCVCLFSVPPSFDTYVTLYVAVVLTSCS